MTKVIPVLCSILILLGFSSIAPAQTITNEPQSLTVNNASSATFTVGATNATAYQWQFDGTNLSGATNSVLALGDVSSNEIGSYTVIVSGANGSVTSTPPATLTIIPGTIVDFTFSGLLGSPGNTIQVQLFDHDKPVTVQNFIHYIRAGGYTNMFIDRVQPGFVLQGGDYGASNRTATTQPLTGWSILTEITEGSNQPTPPYPAQIDNEFGTGPLIHNVYGTLAMAMGSDTNSASSAFFINLGDNSSSLDSQDFSVFGRVISGTSVLQYFNGITTGNGAVASANILTGNGTATNTMPGIAGSIFPVNYTGTNAPTNSNLVFCDFSFVTQPVIDTNPPTVAITNPLPAGLQTNQIAIVQGTASDDYGIADVRGTLVPQAAEDGTIPNGGYGITNYATGTTNWSMEFTEYIYGYFQEPIPPGVYQLTVQAQDGAGNLSAAVTQPFTNTAVLINGNGTVTITAGAGSTNDPIGYPFLTGTNYTLAAIPGPGQEFVSWSYGTNSTTNSTLSFMFENSVYTATFISNTAGGITFTYPQDNSTISNELFDITGTIATNILAPPVTVTVQIFTNSVSNYSVTVPQSTTTDSADWSIEVTNYLPSGSYTIVAVGTDSQSNSTRISEGFTIVANTNPPVVTITSPSAGGVLYLGSALTVQGTAAAPGLPVTSVDITLVPQTNSDGSYPNFGNALSGAAVGTTNWSLDLTNISYIPPGTYQMTATAVAGTGISSSTASELIVVSAVKIAGGGTVKLTSGTNTLSPAVGYPLVYGANYVLKAIPAAGQKFVNWTYGQQVTVDQSIAINFNASLLTATFVEINTPKGTKGLRFIYPTANATLNTNSFLMKGAIIAGKNAPLVTVSAQIVSQATGLQVGPILTATGTTTWSIPITNLPPDNYSVQLIGTNASGFGAVISEDFIVQAFKPLVGTYNGLFLPTSGPITPTNAGFVTMTLTPRGSYSAKLCFPAFPSVVTDYRFQADGESFSPYIIFPAYPLAIVMTLDLTNGSDTITGTISGRSFSSALTCYKTVAKLDGTTTPQRGKYIIDLNPLNWPNTNGYAAVNAGAGGAMLVSGGLPDGANFSESVGVSKDGVWPLYAVPSGDRTNGMLIGWETNHADGSCNGQVFWYKGAGLSKFHETQISANTITTGTNYTAPAAGSYSIVFQGGTLAAPLTNFLTVVRQGGPFKVEPSTNKMAISITANGVLTGHVTNPADKKVLQFKGAFFGQAQGGSGYILDPAGETGYFTLTQELQ